MVETPVLFITFVRPDYARKSWDAIKAAKPKTLYFYSNKGRIDKEGEVERNNEIRSWISEVDWDCNLHTWFREESVDVYTSLMGAKNWAFENEDALIMLEEDCYASPAFFEFCDHFLEVYKDDKRINFITGNNYALVYKQEGEDHYITRSIHHHGWATWKDRWSSINCDMLPEDITETKALHDYYSDDSACYFYFKRLYNNNTEFIKRTKCWDYVKVLNQIKTKSYAVTPICNLVQNIGVKGTHESGEGSIQFSIDNSNLEHYPFVNNQKPFKLSLEYDKIESTLEKHRIWFMRYYLGELYHSFFK